MEAVVPEIPDAAPCLLIGFSSLVGHLVDSPVYIRIGVYGKIVPHVKHALRPLRCGSIVEINEILSVHLSAKGWKQFPQIIRIHIQFPLLKPANLTKVRSCLKFYRHKFYENP